MGSKQEKEQFHEVPVILRRKQVEARVGLTRSTIYRRIAAGVFPKPISLGLRAVGWVEKEINAFITAQIERSRSHGQSPAGVNSDRETPRQPDSDRGPRETQRTLHRLNPTRKPR